MQAFICSASDSVAPGMLARTVLVVEDEELVRDIVARELEEAGYLVIEADSAEDALEILERRPVAVLFTDIRLSGPMDGWTLAEAARTLYPNLQVVYATGYSAQAPRLVRRSVLVPKPYLPSTVIETIARLLGPPGGGGTRASSGRRRSPRLA